MDLINRKRLLNNVYQKDKILHSKNSFVIKQCPLCYLIILCICLVLGCNNSNWNGEWGATTGDCDEMCTVYHSAQGKLMEERGLLDINFPDENERKKHVVKKENGYKIESLFKVFVNNDTAINLFSCDVHYDQDKIEYIVDNLKIHELSDTSLEKDTVTIVLEYYVWGCPCPQWITPKNKVLYESDKKDIKDRKSDYFINVKKANDKVPNPFDLVNQMDNLKFEFKGHFYNKPQFLGDEGEQGPARTLLYYSVRQVK